MQQLHALRNRSSPSKVCSVHISVKLRSAFPDQDALLLASSWAGTADHNMEFSELNAPNLRKVKKPVLGY